MKKLIICLLIALVIFITACTSTNSNVNTNEAVPSQNAELSSAKPESLPSNTPKTENMIYSIGDTTTLGNWEITLDSFEATSSIDNGSYWSFQADEGNLYVVTHFSIKNNGTTADSFLPSFALNDDVTAKIIYKETYTFSSSQLLGHDEELHDAFLNPLSSKSGIIAFSVINVAAESDEMTLVLSLGREDIIYSLK